VIRACAKNGRIKMAVTTNSLAITGKCRRGKQKESVNNRNNLKEGGLE
jgi:hypothetical protein